MEFYQSSRRDFRRQSNAFNIRAAANRLARDSSFSGDDGHTSNGDEQRFSSTLVGSFTKGLPHNRNTSLIDDLSSFSAFVSAINSGNVNEIAALPLGPISGETFTSSMAQNTEVRGWENMAAGLAYSVEGPDPQRVTMPPAPQIDSIETAYELSEIYWMALLRDVRFSNFTENTSNELLMAAADSLSKHVWVTNPSSSGALSDAQRLRIPTDVSTENLFRGTTPGDRVGPYISQFLLVGNTGIGNSHSAADGFINYGSIRIDQRVRTAVEGRNYMTSWQAFIDVQNGADVRGFESYEDGYRFITTPRDLATYVHYDALYQAYLNACLIMLANRVPFDTGLPFTSPDKIDKQTGFALYGGPHILTLVTEVATRALKAVRFQKFGLHRRPRPEAVAGLIDVCKRGDGNNDSRFAPITKLSQNIDEDLLKRIAAHNLDQNANQRDMQGPRGNDRDLLSGDSFNASTFLLPMPFAEGSPMHPSYGAGHATVAGACVTILKAFFDTETTLPFAYQATEDGKSLVPVKLSTHLTVEGELNKLCSNISIGRDWAGVHWFSDYRESITLGEEIAVELLREHKLTFVEDISMTIPSFDGDTTIKI